VEEMASMESSIQLSWMLLYLFLNLF